MKAISWINLVFLRRMGTAVLLAVLLCGNPGVVSAVTQGDINSILNGTPYYDPNAIASGGGSCGDVSLVGAGRIMQIMNFLVGQKNLSPTQAAGIVGNMAHESGLEPERQESIFDRLVPAENYPDPAGGPGWGVAQWTPGSKIIDTFSPKSDANDLGNQLNFLWNQLDGTGPVAENSQILLDIKSVAYNDVLDAVLAFQGNDNGTAGVYAGSYVGFERPKDEFKTVSSRVNTATVALTEYGSGGASSPGSGSTGLGCTSSGGSLPTGTAPQLATQLVPYVNSGKIECNGSGGAHVDNIKCSDITNAANGVSIMDAQTKTGGCDVDALSPALLGVLLGLVQMGHTFDLSAICSDHGQTGTSNPGHSTGQAADFSIIDGVFMGPNDAPWDQAKITAGSKLDQDITSFMPPGSIGFGQVGVNDNGVQCHTDFSFMSGYLTFGDTCHHQHIQVEH